VIASSRRRVVIIDDSPLQCAMWREALERRYGEKINVEIYSDPVVAVSHLRPDIHLVLLDWEMPVLDGADVLEAARERGLNLKRVIITSAHSADELHRVFDCSGCLAVIEKAEPEQQAAFWMILDSLMRRESI
jgi:CheY-like chemotaxis protein